MKEKRNAADLLQMRNLPLYAKEVMSRDRINDWYNSWCKYEIYNEKEQRVKEIVLDEDPNDLFVYTLPTGKKVTAKEDFERENEIASKTPFLLPYETVDTFKAGQVYVSRSGGKDSDVLGDLVSKIHPDVPHIFINTGLEDSSVRRHGESIADKVLVPSKNFVQIITEYGYPVISKEIAGKVHDYRVAKKNGHSSYVDKQLSNEYVTKNGKSNMIDISSFKWLFDAPFRISHQCCDFSKKKPAIGYEKETGRKPYIGTLAEESMFRYKKWILNGCNAFNQDRPTSQPLSFWTEQDILQYIKKYDLKIADAYGEVMYVDEDGFFYDNPFITEGLSLKTTKAERTGCVYCLFGIKYDTERLIRLKHNDRKKYDFVMNGGKYDDEGMWIPTKDGLGYAFIVEWLNKAGNLKIEY